MAKYNEEKDYQEVEVIGVDSVDVLDELQNKSFKKDDDTLDNVQDGSLFNKVPSPYNISLEEGKVLTTSSLGNKELYNENPTILNADGVGGNPRLIEYDFSSLEFVYKEGDVFTLFLEEAGGLRLLDSNYTVQSSDNTITDVIDGFITAIGNSHTNQHPSISPVPQPYSNRYTFTNTGKTLQIENLTTPDAVTTLGSIQVNRAVENYWDAKPFLPDGDILFELLPFYSGGFTEGVAGSNYVVNADIPFDINLGPEQYEGKLIQLQINGVGAASYTVLPADIRPTLAATLVVLRAILKASVDATLTPAGIDYLDTVIDTSSLNRIKIRRSNTTPWVNNLASIDGYGQRGFVNVVDDLTTGGSTDALSATQGVVLNSTVSVVSGNFTGHVSDSSNPHSTRAFDLVDSPNDFSSIDFFNGHTFSSTPSAGTTGLAALTDQDPTTFATFVSDGTNYVLDLDTGVLTNIPRFAFIGFDGNNPTSITVSASVNGTAYTELGLFPFSTFPADSALPLDNIDSDSYQYFRFEIQTQGSGDDVEINTLGVFADSKFTLSTTPGFFGYGFEPNSKNFFDLLDVPQDVVEPNIFEGETFVGGGITNPANMTDGDIQTSATFATSSASNIPGIHVAADATARRTLVINTTASDLDYITQTDTEENYKYTGESSPLGLSITQASSGSQPEITEITITGAVVAGDLLRISSSTEAADYVYVITGGEVDTDAIATAFESQISGTSPTTFTTSVSTSVITFTGVSNNVDLNISVGTSREVDFDSNRVFSVADYDGLLDEVLDGNIVEGDIANLDIGYGGVWDTALSSNQPTVSIINTAQPATTETTTFDCPLASVISPGDYFTFGSTTTDFYGWYEVDGSSGNDPAVPSRTGVQIDINSADAATVVAGTTATTLDTVSGVSSSNLGATVTLTADVAGEVDDFNDVSGKFSNVTISTQGNAGQQVTDITLFDEVADGDRYEVTSTVEGSTFRYKVPSDISIDQVAAGIANTVNATASSITASSSGPVVTLTVNSANTADTVTSAVARGVDFKEFSISTDLDLGESLGVKAAAIYVGGSNSLGELSLLSSSDDVTYTSWAGDAGSLSGWVRLESDPEAQEFNQYWRVFFKIPFVFADSEYAINSIVANSNLPILVPITDSEKLTWNVLTAQKMSYIPTGTSISAGNVQNAITEVDTRLTTEATTLQGGIDTNTSLISTNTTNIGVNSGDILTLQSSKENKSEKGVADGYASLDSGGDVPSTQLPINDSGSSTAELFSSAEIVTRLGTKVNNSLLGANNGVATLDASGVVPSSQIPPLAISEVDTAANATDHQNIDNERGDFVVRTDESKVYVKLNDNAAPTTIATDYTEIVTPANIVSVNGDTGPNVTLTTSNIAEGTNEYYADAKVDGRIAAASINDLSDVNITLTANRAVRVNGAGSGLDETTFTLPSDNGSIGQFLQTDGAGGTAWAAVAGGGSSNTKPVTSKTANYTVTTSDCIILVNASSGAVTITLPTAASAFNAGDGNQFIVKKTDSTPFPVNVVVASSGTMDGQTTLSITNQYDTEEVVSNGSEYSRI